MARSGVNTKSAPTRPTEIRLREDHVLVRAIARANYIGGLRVAVSKGRNHCRSVAVTSETVHRGERIKVHQDDEPLALIEPDTNGVSYLARSHVFYLAL